MTKPIPTLPISGYKCASKYMEYIFAFPINNLFEKYLPPPKKKREKYYEKLTLYDRWLKFMREGGREGKEKGLDKLEGAAT